MDLLEHLLANSVAENVLSRKKKSKMVSPDKDTIKRKRSVHYTDESFNNLREDKEYFPEVKELPFPKSGEFIDKNIESKKDAPFWLLDN